MGIELSFYWAESRWLVWASEIVISSARDWSGRWVSVFGSRAATLSNKASPAWPRRQPRSGWLVGRCSRATFAPTRF